MNSVTHRTGTDHCGPAAIQAHKAKGTFIKSQVIEHEIVAIQAEMVQLKRKLAISKNVEQAGTKKT